MDRMARDIIKTIEYGQKYGVEYGNDEIQRRLIGKRAFDPKQLAIEIKKIRKEAKTTPLSKFRIEKVKLAEKFVKSLTMFPGIKFVAITGSVAAGYCDKNDDIDLMIVTGNYRLWWCRLLLRIYVWLANVPHRRYGKKEAGDEFCFNLWMEEGRMELPKEKQVLRNSMDAILMIPIMDKKNIYERFFGDNKWIGRFNAQQFSTIPKKETKLTSIIFQRINPLSWINFMVFWPQYWYMRHKIKQEIVDRRFAFFHPSDRIRHAIKNRR